MLFSAYSEVTNKFQINFSRIPSLVINLEFFVLKILFKNPFFDTFWSDSGFYFF